MLRQHNQLSETYAHTHVPGPEMALLRPECWGTSCTDQRVLSRTTEAEPHLPSTLLERHLERPCLSPPRPHSRLPEGLQGSTSGVSGGPPGSAGQDDVTHPQAHGHQKPALQEPPLQGVSPGLLPRLPHMGSGRAAASGAGPRGRARWAWLLQLFLLWKDKGIWAPTLIVLHSFRVPNRWGGGTPRTGGDQGWRVVVCVCMHHSWGGPLPVSGPRQPCWS